MRYEAYELERRGGVWAIYDNVASEPVCKRDRSPMTTRDPHKAARLANQLSEAKDAPTIAGVLMALGATQGDAWKYAQSIYDL